MSGGIFNKWRYLGFTVSRFHHVFLSRVIVIVVIYIIILIITLITPYIINYISPPSLFFFLRKALIFNSIHANLTKIP